MCIASAASPNTNTLAPAPATPVAQAPPVVENTPPAPVPQGTLGTRLVEHVINLQFLVLSEHSITATENVMMNILLLKPCWVL